MDKIMTSVEILFMAQLFLLFAIVAFYCRLVQLDKDIKNHERLVFLTWKKTNELLEEYKIQNSEEEDIGIK